MVAELKQIDVEESLARLERKIAAPTMKPKEQAPIIPHNIRKWMSVAAALVGFVALSYVALQAINSGQFGNAASDHSVYSSRPSVYPEDEIQILPAKKKVTVKKQSFKEDQITEIVSGREIALLEEESDGMSFQEESAGAANFAEDRGEVAANTAVITAPNRDNFSHPTSYSKLLARYGYRLVDPTLLNTPRGATVSALPSNHYRNFSRNAMTASQMTDFKETFEADYVARFPFNGIVKASFIIDKNGQPTNFQVIEAVNAAAAEVTKTLFFEKAEWQIPLNITNQPSAQEVVGTVSFGNSILIELEFVE